MSHPKTSVSQLLVKPQSLSWKVLEFRQPIRKQQEDFFTRSVMLQIQWQHSQICLFVKRETLQKFPDMLHTQCKGTACILGSPSWHVSVMRCLCAFTYSVEQRLGAPLLLLGSRSGDGPLRVFLQVLGVVGGWRLLHVLRVVLGD